MKGNSILTPPRSVLRAPCPDGDDAITGEIGAVAEGGTGNILEGGAGDDTVSGSAGEDRIAGGIGDDALLGGGDADTYVFNVAADQGTNTLGDFDGAEDLLFFRGIADDLDLVTTVTEAGAELAVTVTFDVGTVIVLAGRGTGEIDSIADLVENPATQLLGPTRSSEAGRRPEERRPPTR